MRNIKVPEVDNIILWDSVVKNKRIATRKKLTPYRNIINERYIYYEHHCSNLDDVQPLDSLILYDVKKELAQCYNDNVNFSKEKRRLLSNTLRCPYCLINKPDTLDHYFNKRDYPEYAIYIPNLIPCCTHCNRCKGTDLFDSYKHRLFIHFYYDYIPNDKFLYIRFNHSKINNVPEICVFLKFKDKVNTENLIKNHFKKLNLFCEYRNVVNDKLSEIIREIKFYKNKGISLVDFKFTLSTRYKACKEQYGENYWETCVYEGLLNSNEFLEKYF